MNGDNKKNQNMGKLLKSLVLAGHLGYLMLAPILISIIIGYRLDIFFKMTPVFLLTGTIIGVIVAFRNLFTLKDKFGK